LRVTEAVAGGGGGHARFWSSVSFFSPSLFRSSSSCQVPTRESRFKLQTTSGKLQTKTLLIGNTNRLEIKENTKRPKRKYKQHQLPSPLPFCCTKNCGLPFNSITPPDAA
jgi:hypothetical protein